MRLRAVASPIGVPELTRAEPRGITRAKAVLGRLFAPKVGLDPGAANTLVFVRGRGVVVDEPTVATIRTGTRRIEAVGRDAMPAVGRTPRRLETARPIHGGAVADRDLFEETLRRFLRKARLPRVWPPFTAMVAVPARATAAERAALVASLRKLGAGEVETIDQVVAAAWGARVAVDTVVVDIGAGVTDGGLFRSHGASGLRWSYSAGEEMDAAIAEHVADTRRLAIGPRTAECLKTQIGSALGSGREGGIRVKGRCLRTGVPRDATISAGEVREALAATLARIAGTVRAALNAAPRGTPVVLTGGSALLPGIDRFLSVTCGAAVRVADDPRSCVIRGIGRALDSPNVRRG